MSGPPGGEKNIEGNRGEFGLLDATEQQLLGPAEALELKRNLR